MKITKNLSNEDKRMLNKIFRRSLIGQASRVGGQARQHAIGFVYSIMPALDRYYEKGSEEKRDALVRHTQFFNVTSNLSTLVMGIVASMEREKSTNEDFDVNSITAIKVALMGPLSGIGDSLFIGVIRAIASGIAISLGMNGSILAPIAFLLIYNVPSHLIRYYLTYAGYVSGSEFITSMYKSGAIKVLTKAAGILGLVMVGAMTASTVQFSTILEIPVQGQDPVLVQTYLDAIFRGLVPLSLTLFCKYLLDKKVNINYIMLGIVGLAIVLALFRIA